MKSHINTHAHTPFWPGFGKMNCSVCLPIPPLGRAGFTLTLSIDQQDTGEESCISTVMLTYSHSLILSCSHTVVHSGTYQLCPELVEHFL